MITIEQLLESVDLDFEPRFVTKDKSGEICAWGYEPCVDDEIWNCAVEQYQCFGSIKLAEFDGKDWKECIYEVPRKEIKIEKLETDADYMQLSSASMTRNQVVADMIMEKINELVDAVNELKARMELPRLKPDLTEEDLRKMMCDPKYWRDEDFAINQKVQNGFKKLYGDKN